MCKEVGRGDVVAESLQISKGRKDKSRPSGHKFGIQKTFVGSFTWGGGNRFG